ncbi:MAG TPA: sensor histidine kinase [Clostridiaceae bacterium]|jgi:two-component system LytT family sensor kinase|nr:sensor histidine kinase [Clostridiaceae bacterium]HBX49375.1 sensor histidine kinase [Clostridiaceae bacterium]HCL50098.1 sensor histidine kinase [Clostridiaceae bacterium]
MINVMIRMINNLGYVVLIVFIITRLKYFKKIVRKDKFTKKDKLILSIIFGAFGIIGTYMGTNVNGAIANTRIIGVMAGGILCGPEIGIFAGLIAGIHRFLIDINGITSAPCAITTIISGFAAGYVYKISSNGNNSKWKFGLWSGIIMESLEMLLILLISKPYERALTIVKSIYIPMSFTNALGIAILIILVENTFEENEAIAAKQAKLSLEIANKTLPLFREINKDSLREVCTIIKESIGADAVSITDKEYVAAHVGLGDDHHIPGEKIATKSTKKVLNEGIILSINHPEQIECNYANCPLKSAIISPLKDGKEIIGTLKIYYGKENAVTFSVESLAEGLSQIISTQFEISKLGKLQEMANKAEIKALQAQINPHFMFNALNTISSLIRTNPDKARELIVDLSTYLRYNISQGLAPVDLSKELEQVKAYVEIEKARFGDKLNMLYDIDEDINIKIPCLIIQPIVENAIKHGILEGTGKGTVKLTINKIDDKNINVIVEDNGQGISEDIIKKVYENKMDENKIGISNVHNRLIYLYGEGLKIQRLNMGTRITYKIKSLG